MWSINKGHSTVNILKRHAGAITVNSFKALICKYAVSLYVYHGFWLSLPLMPRQCVQFLILGLDIFLEPDSWIMWLKYCETHSFAGLKYTAGELLDVLS